MRTHVGARRAATSLLLLVLLTPLGGCGRFGAARPRELPEASTATTATTAASADDAGKAAPAPGAPGAPAAPAAPATTIAPSASPAGRPSSPGPEPPGAFEVTVLGRDDGKPRPGIRAAVDGPASGTIASDSRGVLAFSGPDGTYDIRIEPSCGSVLEVRTGATGKATIFAGQVARGTLSVAWRHRFAPGGRTTYEKADRTSSTSADGRSWRIGTPYLVGFDVIDRCVNHPAPGATFPTYRFSSVPGVEVGEVAVRADSQGRGSVRLTCRRAVDDVSLIVTDAEAEHDRTDLFERAFLDDSPPECVD